MMRNNCTAILICLLLLGGCEPAGTPVVGTLERDRIVLRAEAGEPVLEWAVAEGGRVAPGTLLLRQDPARARARLAESRARLAETQARLDELIRGPRRESILESRANVAEIRARLENAREEYRRIAALVEDRLLPPSRLDEARASRDAIDAQLAAATARLKAQLEGTTLEQLDQARAAVDAARAAVEQTRIALQRLDIRAPVAGRVEALPYHPGEEPRAGDPVAVLLADKPVYARVFVPQNIHAGLSVSDRAVIELAGRGRTLEGRVQYLAAEASYTPYYALTEYDRGRLSYLAEIRVTEDAGDLPTGIPVSVRFPQPAESGDE